MQPLDLKLRPGSPGVSERRRPTDERWVVTTMTLVRENSKACNCGHEGVAHEHYRRGSDCAFRDVCGCVRYRSPGILRSLRESFYRHS
jgi:hypothetical protein